MHLVNSIQITIPSMQPTAHSYLAVVNCLVLPDISENLRLTVIQESKGLHGHTDASSFIE